MANVHRIGDYQNDNERGPQRQPMRMGNMFSANNPANDEDTRNNPLMRAYMQQPGDPRQETFWQMLKIYFCPGFTWKSCIFIIVLIDVLMFIVSLAKTDGLDNDYFLGIETRTLCSLGAKDSYKLHEGQVQRWLTPMILHVGFLHILQNSIFQMIIGSFFELIVGPLRFLAIYVLSGTGGILMSALVNDDISVGASTAIFGVTAGLLAFIIVNWKAMESMQELRCCLLCFVIILVVINVLMGLSKTENIDNYGHLGGFVTGLPISMALMPILQTSMNRHNMPGWTYEKYCQIVGAVAGFLWLGLGILLFYTTRHPRIACP